MRTMYSRDEVKRVARGLLTAFACALIATVLGAGATLAQEGDLSGSAGVFIEPRRTKEPAPRERAAPQQRTAPRRARTRPAPSNNPTPANTKPSGKTTTPAVTAESLNARGGAAVDAGRYAEAVEPLRQALKLKPDYADAQRALRGV